MVNSDHCMSDDCENQPAYYCFSHKNFTCNKCSIAMHTNCDTQNIKNKEDVEEFLLFLKELVNKLKTICENHMATLLMEPQISELTPFFFEFKIMHSNIGKLLRGNDQKSNWTVLYHKLSEFQFDLKKLEAYTKLIVFSFEQKVQVRASQKDIGINLEKFEAGNVKGTSKKKPERKHTTPIIEPIAIDIGQNEDSVSLSDSEESESKDEEDDDSCRELEQPVEIEQSKKRVSCGSLNYQAANEYVKKQRPSESETNDTKILIRPMSAKQRKIRDLKHRSDEKKKCKRRIAIRPTDIKRPRPQGHMSAQDIGLHHIHQIN